MASINSGTNNNYSGSHIYNMNSGSSHSSSTFFHSAPVELTTISGYKDFLNNISEKQRRKCVTVLKEDMSQGYILEDGDIIANIYGEAKTYLVDQACDE
ncbi:hypothetical protein MOUN0_M07096 [Monosporozyma unispora]|nr:hypothetical protein C6P44_000203 [Kazachstania unispora]